LSLVSRIATAKRFQAENVEKVLRLKQLLVEFGRHGSLIGKLVLKGGTALNLFYLNLPRLSVDIDLNYVGEIARQAMLAERPRVIAALEQVCGALGYGIRRATEEHALVDLVLEYRNHAGRPDRVEVEVNFLFRVCALPPQTRTATKFEDETECTFPVLAIEELMAGKLRAMIDRQHPRDLYDVYRFRTMGIAHNPDILRRLAILFGSTLPHDLRSYTTERTERTLTADLERLLYPLLRADDRPTAREMLDDVHPLLTDILQPLGETDYLDAMRAGRYEPELLFSDQPVMVGRVRLHPALLWKAESVARYLTRSDRRDSNTSKS
jgi:predicted nucleotidyltransferase component of viral defense system